MIAIHAVATAVHVAAVRVHVRYPSVNAAPVVLLACHQVAVKTSRAAKTAAVRSSFHHAQIAACVSLVSLVDANANANVRVRNAQRYAIVVAVRLQNHVAVQKPVVVSRLAYSSSI